MLTLGGVLSEAIHPDCDRVSYFRLMLTLGGVLSESIHPDCDRISYLNDIE